ncbi:MAG TPA: DUF2169 domain-containing protein, partial [Byssovorax sp.]
IAQGPLQADVFEDDDEAREGEPVYASDFADAKLAAEVLVRGTCHPPGRHAVPESTVSVALGAWSKTLRVFGPRARGSKAPEPFTSMRLRWSKARGGPGNAANPVGVGDDGSGLLPNVEYPDGRADPAGFGPINPSWRARASKVGKKYGPEYAPRAPYFAEDFDWSYFQAAPVDQRFERFPRGDEELVLTHLSPAEPIVRTKLPGLRVRCFVHDRVGAFREVRMLLDTIFVDGDASQVSLTWRGRTPVTDAEFEDVKTVLVASEEVASPAKPADDYRADIAAFEADPLGVGAALPGPEGALARAQTKEARAAAIVEIIEREAPGAVDAAARAGTPLAGAIADATGANEGAPPPVPMADDPRVTLDIDVQALARARDEIKQRKPSELAAFDAKMARLAEIDPNFRPPGAPPPGGDELGPGADLSGRDLSGRDLTGVDLAGASLRGAILKGTKLRSARLAGADLEGALLFRADLGEADLRGARLVRVNAAEATFVDARLDDAVLDNGYFARIDGRGARFDGARGARAMFVDAELSRANFTRAELDQCDFERARLDGARLTGARLGRCVFMNASADEAKFDEAKLDGANLEGARLVGASLEVVHADAANFAGANLERADLRYGVFAGAHFSRARLVRARLDAADLHDANFFKADLEGASLTDAKLCSADLCKTTVARARFDRANLYDAKLLGARGVGASFEGANLARCVRPS